MAPKTEDSFFSGWTKKIIIFLGAAVVVGLAANYYCQPFQYGKMGKQAFFAKWHLNAQANIRNDLPQRIVAWDFKKAAYERQNAWGSWYPSAWWSEQPGAKPTRDDLIKEAINFKNDATFQEKQANAWTEYDANHKPEYMPLAKTAMAAGVGGLLAAGGEHSITISGGKPATGTKQNGTPGKQIRRTNNVPPRKPVKKAADKVKTPTTKKGPKTAKKDKKDVTSKGMSWWGILLIVFAVLLVIGAGVYYFVFMPTEEDEEVYDEMAEL